MKNDFGNEKSIAVVTGPEFGVADNPRAAYPFRMARRTKALIVAALAVTVCTVAISRHRARPWYFDEAECEARLLGKTPAEVELAIGRRPDYTGRPRRERPELDESQWGPGISARTAWRFDWGAITVEYDGHERSVSAEVQRYQRSWGERDRILVSRW